VTNYIWKAKDRSGKPVVREIVANTAAEAKAILTADGYTDLQLHQDEVMAATVEQFDDNVTVFGERVVVTAADRIKHAEKPRNTFGHALLQGIWEGKGLILLLLVAAGFFYYRGAHLWATLLAAGIPIWLTFVLFVSVPSIYYRKLIKASEWHRWDEVLDIIKVLKSNSRFNFVKVPEAELARNRAKALTGLGRLEEALAGYQKYEGQPGCPGWLHKAFIAGFYETAQQYDKAIEYNLLSLQEKENPSMYPDLAYRLARYKRDIAGARKALNEAEKAVLPEFAKPFLLRARGWIYYLEQNHAEARKAFEESIAYMDRTRNQPFREGSIAVAKAHLACVLAQQGEFDLAKENFATARKYLEATDQKDLLDECRNTIGVL
jgi:tetratricopeptide (TPR) repeat protein